MAMKFVLSYIAFILCNAWGLLQTPAHARPVPADLKPLIEQGTRLLRHARADLNGDGRTDYVFVLERLNAEDEHERQRSLRIAVRGRDRKLRVVKANDEIILCSSCGGMWAEPLDKLKARRNSFTVRHYGGSSGQWSYAYRFDYSLAGDSWYLVHVETGAFSRHHPDQDKILNYRSPGDFGKIDIADFQPWHYLAVGRK